MGEEYVVSKKKQNFMKKMALRIFQHEVKRQCKFALMAGKDLNIALRDADQNRIWYSVQGFLVAAGNISKLLWPPEPAYRQRGKELRKSLSVPSDSPLRPRRFRNHLEHFDERLERWAATSKRHNFVDSVVGPTGLIKGVSLEDCLRMLDTTKRAVTFRGDVYYFQPVASTIAGLCKRATVEAKKPHGK